jgi:hypothetical protein
MNSKGWLETNNRYLAASLVWLRLRLRRPAGDHTPLLSNSGSEVAVSVTAKRKGKRSAPNDELEEAAAERETAAASNPPPSLLMLAERLGLSTFERDTLLLCAAMELDPSVAALCAQAQADPNRKYPTFGLALLLLDDPSWDALSAHRPLRHARLLEINQPGATPLTASPLRADERIVNFIKGLNSLDDGLASLVSPAPVAESASSTTQQAIVEAILLRLRQTTAERILPVVQLVGADSVSKLAVAETVCAALHRRLYRIGSESLPTQTGESETFARLWQRETMLLSVALYIDSESADSSATDANASLQRFVSRDVGLVFLGLRETPLRLSSPNFSVDVSKPTAKEQSQAWSDILATQAAETEIATAAQVLAGQFNLNLHEIREAASLALSIPSGKGALSERLWGACRDLTRPRLDLLAQRLEPKATWNELVLPDEPMTLLRQIAGQVRERHKVYEQWGFAEKMSRGFGISALFEGHSGTGKTMAAEVIANDLQLNLYRIDLSAVVSKYIGETEKNLRRLFDAAEQGGAILFFDEADALFGKRSEVKDSHDRYANIEINYLLQRIEAFSGLAILATNMKGALDTAFMRRLRFVVHFQFPSINERKLIWEKALPPQTPKAALDFERLARLNITGGNIHSIALSAAFMAAQNGQTVTMPILLRAARMELRKLDKPFNEAEFR